MSDAYISLHKSHLDERELRILNARKCLKVVRTHIAFTSVVDFGCGIGGWLAAAKQLGAAKITGIEGEWVKGKDILIEQEELKIADLSKDAIDFNRSYDLCLSIEVAEHLPPESADGFCNNLVNASNFIVFSAAIPGQGGVNHLNEQKPRYWVDRFCDRGMIPLELIRPAICNEPKMYSWLQQNLMMFMRYDLLFAHPHLAQFALPRRHFYVRYFPM